MSWRRLGARIPIDAVIVARLEVAHEIDAASQGATPHVEEPIRGPQPHPDQKLELQLPDFLPQPSDQRAIIPPGDLVVAQLLDVLIGETGRHPMLLLAAQESR
jgi:hypothetical protein